MSVGGTAINRALGAGDLPVLVRKAVEAGHLQYRLSWSERQFDLESCVVAYPFEGRYMRVLSPA
jgi:hypothetical protein